MLLKSRFLRGRIFDAFILFESFAGALETQLGDTYVHGFNFQASKHGEMAERSKAPD